MKTITHDDRDSSYIIAWNDNGKWRQRAYRAASALDAPLPYRSSVYMTRNGFVGKRRANEHCRQINAMMFDIDCHGERFVDDVPDVIGAIDDACFEGTIPMPTMLVNTGRGVQVYYVLKRSISCLVKDGTQNSKVVAYFKDVEAGLAEAVREAVGGVEGAKLDESVFDLARVGRIPGTYNPKARSWCTLVSNSEKFYDLKELSAFGRKKAWPHIKRNTARNLKRATGLLRSRLHGIERLQRHRKFNCVGSRENMCFVYYNTATQIYGPEKALQVTLQLNAKFNTPLPVADIEQISRTVDNNVVLYGTYKGETGFYPLKASSVAEKLSMTQEEMATTKFFGGKRERDRAALKARNAAKRKAIDEKIAHMYKMGSTQKAIAKRIGCSVRKVAYVLSSLGIGNDDRYTLEEKFSQVIALHDKDAILRQPSWLCAGLPLPSPDEGLEGAQHSDDESWWRFNPGSMLMGCGARTPATARSKAVLKGVEARRC